MATNEKILWHPHQLIWEEEFWEGYPLQHIILFSRGTNQGGCLTLYWNYIFYLYYTFSVIKWQLQDMDMFKPSYFAVKKNIFFTIYLFMYKRLYIYITDRRISTIKQQNFIKQNPLTLLTYSAIYFARTNQDGTLSYLWFRSHCTILFL